MTALRIGILIDSDLKQQYLTNLVSQAGHSVACTSRLLTAEPIELDKALDAWIIDVTEAEHSTSELTDELPEHTDSFIDRLLETATVPVILSDSSEYPENSDEHKAWLRRMTVRLQRLSGDINLQQAERAPYLWVLGASTGGPAAVKEFLSHLPAELGIAFVYVQHIDANYSSTLIKMMSSAGSYPTALACQGAVLQRDSIALITAEKRVDILENGTFSLSNNPWGGCYAPSIDQVAANVARVYKKRSGLIVFTGMGDDGATSSRLIKQQGGQVWVQTPASCTSSSMPESALATDSVNFTGTPKELAQRLAVFTRQKQPHYLKGKRSYESSTPHRI